MTLAQIELWAFRSLAILAALGGIVWWIYAKGEAHTQAKWDQATAEAREQTENENVENRRIEANRQQRVLVAEATAKQAQMDLADYRHAHPIRLALSRGVHTTDACGPTHATEGTGDGAALAAGQASGILQPQGSRDPGDQLDELLAEADSINDSYSICLATRLGVAEKTIPREAH